METIEVNGYRLDTVTCYNNGIKTKGDTMKTYELTKQNWKKIIGDRAVVFEKDKDNLKIIGSVQVERGFKGQVTVIPNIEINGKTYSPSLINPDEMREDFGWKTFSM